MPGRREQPAEPGADRDARQLLHAFASPDSYVLVLLLILVTYALSAGLSTSWAASLVIVVQIVTVWVALRASRARRSARVLASCALALSALAAAANLFFHDQIDGGTVASWVSCLLYLIAPLSIVWHLILRRVVDGVTLVGAIDAYLMAGMFFAFLYHSVGLTQQMPPFFGSQGRGTLSAGPFLLLHDAHHDRLREPRPGRQPGADLRSPRDGDRSAVPGDGSGEGRKYLAAGPGQEAAAGRLQRRVTVPQSKLASGRSAMPAQGVPAPAQALSAGRFVIVPGIRSNRPSSGSRIPGLAAVIPTRVLRKAISSAAGTSASADFDGAEGGVYRFCAAIVGPAMPSCKVSDLEPPTNGRRNESAKRKPLSGAV